MTSAIVTPISNEVRKVEPVFPSNPTRGYSQNEQRGSNFGENPTRSGSSNLVGKLRVDTFTSSDSANTYASGISVSPLYGPNGRVVGAGYETNRESTSVIESNPIQARELNYH